MIEKNKLRRVKGQSLCQRRGCTKKAEYIFNIERKHQVLACSEHYHLLFPKHVCQNQSHCETCIGYINSIPKPLRSIESISNKEVRIQSIISCGKIPQASMGKRHIKKRIFDLPKPVLARPQTL